MPEVEGVSLESAAPIAATGDSKSGNLDSSVPTTEAVTTESVEQPTQERAELTETQKQEESRIPESFRTHAKEMETDIREKYKPAFVGLEKVATDVFGSSTPEDVQATIQAVQAAAPLLRIVLDSNAEPATVINTLRQSLPAEHLESIAWAALNDPVTQDVILQDPEVQAWISEKVLNGRSIEEAQAILTEAAERFADPEREAWRKERSEFQAERQWEQAERARLAGQQRSQDLMVRFFEKPAEQVIADDFKLVAPEGASEADRQLFQDAAKDIRFAAQGRFLEDNMDAYMQVQNLYAQGRGLQAQAAEIRLQNKYHASLIKTAARYANFLKAHSEIAGKTQQEKLAGVRPDTSGSVGYAESAGNKMPTDASSATYFQDMERYVTARLGRS